MTVRARRGLAVVGVALSAALTMAGCSAHPGVAATVGDRTISQEELARTQRELGTVLNDATPSAILGVLIETPLYVQAAKDHGAGISDADATKVLTDVSKQAGLEQQDGWGEGSLDIARYTLAVDALQKLDDATDVLDDLKKKTADLDVTVNPQYGTWQDGALAAVQRPWLATADASTAAK